MSKRAIWRRILLLLLAVMNLGMGMTVSAESSQYVPYESYTYWSDISGSERKAVYNRPMYETARVLDAADIGTDPFTELRDVCVDDAGYVYLLDADSRIVVLDEQYRLVNEITSVRGEEEYQFTGASDIFVHKDGTLYISDTENKRVLHCDKNGTYMEMFTLPDSPLIPEAFEFRPIRTVADSRGYVYVLSDGSYYGALLYAPDKSFVGFYGANAVQNGIAGAFRSLLNRMFPNNEKASRRSRVLPYVFNDIAINDKDFVYTLTDTTDTGTVKKLAPGSGSNILNSTDVRFKDDNVNTTYGVEYWYDQQFAGLAIDEDEFIYCLEAKYGRIFVYDPACRMVTAFGGGMTIGTQKGTFLNVSAIAIKSGDILVCDRGNNSLTVFECNEYGKKVHELTAMTLRGDYLESKEGWEEVIKKDRNLQLAYNGLARACLAEKDYGRAMELALKGYDRETYSLAYEYQRKEFASDHFALIFVGAVLAVGVVIAVLVVSMKRELRLFKNEKVHLMFRTLLHPGDAFEDIKYKRKGSVRLSLILLAVFYVTAVLKVLWGGFMFTQYDPGTFNSFWVLVQSAGLVILWICSNWLITSLAGGTGTMKEIAVVTCYSLLPLILEQIVWTALTNVLLPSEASFLSIFKVIAVLWFLLELTTGMMRIHDYSFGKFVGTSTLSVIGMAVIIFLMVLVGILVQQLGGFLVTLVMELLM